MELLRCQFVHAFADETVQLRKGDTYASASNRDGSDASGPDQAPNLGSADGQAGAGLFDGQQGCHLHDVRVCDLFLKHGQTVS